MAKVAKAKGKIEGRVELKIPRGSGANDDPNFFVSINGKNYIIPKGTTVMVPPEVAAEYHRSEAARDAYYEAVDSLKNTDVI